MPVGTNDNPHEEDSDVAKRLRSGKNPRRRVCYNPALTSGLGFRSPPRRDPARDGERGILYYVYIYIYVYVYIYIYMYIYIYIYIYSRSA